MDKIKTKLTNLNLNFEASEKFPLGAHIHYTTGAASLMDEAFLLKSQNKELTKEEQEIIKVLGKPGQTDKEEEIMDELVLKELQAKADGADAIAKELADIKKELATGKVEKSLAGFGLEDAALIDVTGVLVDLDADKQAVICKAFTFLKDFKEVKEEGETSIQKELSQEAGFEGTGDIVEKSMSQRITDERIKLEAK